MCKVKTEGEEGERGRFRCSITSIFDYFLER